MTVIGVVDLGVRVLLELEENKRKGMKLCAVVLDEEQVTLKAVTFDND